LELTQNKHHIDSSIDPIPVFPYHIHVATRRTYRKTSQKAQSRGSQAIVIFWLIFIVVIICVFIANAQTIQKNFNLFKTRLTTTGIEDTPLPTMVEEEPDELVIQVPPPTVERQPDQRNETAPQSQTATPESGTRTQPSASERPAAQTTPAPNTTQPQSAPQTRDRNIYFTQIDKDGQILHSRVTRRLPVSDSPMQDVLNALLIGPSADELNRGLLNLIPRNTRILNATVRGNTAYISFSEDFLFNTFGVEGYVAQLRQIVWTVTEFSNVSDVQILVEGRRLDYLGEGIWIGSPISRQSF